MFAFATDGIVDSHLSETNGFDTFSGSTFTNSTDFVGLCNQSQEIFAIKVDHGNQFIDGGSWASEPTVYLLKNPLDTNQNHPENDPANWEEVPRGSQR